MHFHFLIQQLDMERREAEMRAKREEAERKRLEEALRARQEEERKRLEEEELARKKQVELKAFELLFHCESLISDGGETDPVLSILGGGIKTAERARRGTA